MKNNPIVSIIIVNWNGGQVMGDCLDYLSKIEYHNWELIIIDNGSSDNSEQVSDRYIFGREVKLIKNSGNLGFAKANNQGFEVSKGKYILLLNNDTKVEKSFLSKLVTEMEKSPKVGVMQPKILMIDKPEYLDNAGSFMTRIGFLQHWGFGQKDSKEFSRTREIFSAKGACMLIRRDVIEMVGLFDSDFFSYFEESDFCWRVWLIGYKVIFFPEALIYHKIGFTIRRLNVYNINFHYYKNRICSLIKNLEFTNILTILPAHLIISLGIVIAFFVRLQPKNSWMILQAIWWNVVNLPKTLEKRKEIQTTRVVSDNKLFDKLMHPVNWVKYFQDFKRVEQDLRRS